MRLLHAALVTLPLLGATGGCATTRSGGGDPPDSLTDTSTMAKLPAVTFKMGYDRGEQDEVPVHDVALKAFLLDRHEVTNADYARCVDAGVCGSARSQGHRELGGAKQPVVGVTWGDAFKYCEWVGKRLPTEAEHERAARGAEGRFYAFEGRPDASRANLQGTADGFEFTAPVGSFPKGMSREAPVLDLTGNAAEWVNDWYDPTYYSSRDDWKDPQGPARSDEKTIRGGSYLDNEYQARAAARSRLADQQSSTAVGFRCAADP
jgi:formylglycine-generating enzyme required for sulfatase activity